VWGSQPRLAKKNPFGVILGGCLALIVGALVTFASLVTGTPALLFVGTAVAGLGFGPAFMGAYRSTVALAPPDDRAGLITAIYIVSYLSTGIPAVIGGIATSHYGLHKTALVHSVAVAALAAAAVGLLAHRNGYREGGAWNPPSRCASGPRHGATVRANQATPQRSESMSADRRSSDRTSGVQRRLPIV
jgi:predicted MFS family arabinose efflux permease